MDKITKKQIEAMELEAEAKRRYAVAQEKLAGYLIEFIESEREKQKKKKLMGCILGCFMKVTDFKNNIQMAMINPNVKYTLLIETYEALVNETLDISKLLGEQPPEFLDLSEIDNLQGLYVATGQLQWYLFGKLIECI